MSLPSILKPPSKKNDELLKAMFEENFVDFLRFIYSDADELFDFTKKLTFMDKEFIEITGDRERKTGKRIADFLVKAYLKDGAEKWLLVHTEIEGGSDPELPFRIYEYNYKIFDRYKVQVESIVVYIGKKNQPRPTEYRQVGIRSFIHFHFVSYHIFDHDEEELLAMDNIFAYIVLACQNALSEGKVPEKELGEQRTKIARVLIEADKYDKDRIINFLVFLKNFLFIRDKQINSKLINTFIQ